MVASSRRMQSCCPTSCYVGLRGLVYNLEVNLKELTDSRTENPWVVQVALASFDQENLKVVIEVGQSGRNKVSVCDV